MFETINPANGKVIASYHADENVEDILQAVAQAQTEWRRTTFATRAGLLERVAAVLEQDKDDLARLMSLEMGKPLPQSRSEIEKCAWVCRFYAEKAESFLSEEAIQTEARESFVTYQPLGVVLAIMPWNFPFWQVFRFCAPALMAGNGALLKHAPNVFGCAQAIEAIFRKADAPTHIFRNLIIDHQTTSAVIAHPAVAAVTLTGSTRAGKLVAAQAGIYLKKTVLELGGSDPYLILADADVPKAAATCMASRLLNTGQSCIAAKRFIVVPQVKNAFEDACFEIIKKKTMGPALEGSFDLGPLARVDLRNQLKDQFERTKAQGAKLLFVGKPMQEPSAFHPAVLFTDVTPGMTAFDEEIFGPIAAIIPARDEAHAVALANQTPFGLGAAIFSADLERARHLAVHHLEAGACFINDFVKSDPRLPFGGIKESGYGRELASFGIREFVNIKTIQIA